MFQMHSVLMVGVEAQEPSAEEDMETVLGTMSKVMPVG